MVELLAPAGNKESFIAAVQSGADAVYMGLGKYNARAMADNFSLDEYIWCIKYAHIYGVKVYLTFNILMYDEEMEEALNMLFQLYKHGLDAVILQDIGLSTLIKKYIPNLEMHASTQMTVNNIKQVKFLEKLGFSRVVLAREMTINEIEYIAKNTNLELEVFVHGALCVSYSGACLMSSMIGNRSGNRGKCAGTCRLKYDLYEEDKKICSGNLLSKKDIYGLEHIKKLMDIGVKSFKIEGRGKTKEYVSLVTKKYRKVIDGKKITNEDEKELLQMFNRTSKSYGYLDKIVYKESISYKTAKNTGLELGEVLDIKNKLVKIKLKEDLAMHDGVENSYSSNVTSTIVTCIKDENFNLINKDVKAGLVVWIGDFKVLPKKGDIINKTSSKKIIDNEINALSKITRKVNITLDLLFKYNQKVYVKYINDLNGQMKEMYIDILPEKAINRNLTAKDVEVCFSKTKESYYNFNINDLKIENDIFLSVSNLNKIRNYIIDEISKVSEIFRDNITLNFKNEFKENNNLKVSNKNSLFIYSYNEDKLSNYNSSNADYIYLNVSDIYKNGIEILDNINKDIYVYIPNIILKNLENYIDNNMENILSNIKIKGVLLGSINYLDKIKYWKEKYNLNIIIDYTLNVNNSYTAKFYLDMGADIITLSPELSHLQAINISKIIPIEVVSDFVTAMTSRFCLIRAFKEKCNCKNNKYYVIDSYKNKYYIISDNVDCIMKLVRKIPYECKILNCNVRKCCI